MNVNGAQNNTGPHTLIVWTKKVMVQNKIEEKKKVNITYLSP